MLFYDYQQVPSPIIERPKTDTIYAWPNIYVALSIAASLPNVTILQPENSNKTNNVVYSELLLH